MFPFYWIANVFVCARANARMSQRALLAAAVLCPSERTPNQQQIVLGNRRVSAFSPSARSRPAFRLSLARFCICALRMAVGRRGLWQECESCRCLRHLRQLDATQTASDASMFTFIDIDGLNGDRSRAQTGWRAGDTGRGGRNASTKNEWQPHGFSIDIRDSLNLFYFAWTDSFVRQL